MTHYGVEHLDSTEGMTSDWWDRAIQGSRSEDAKDDPIGKSTRGTGGFIMPDEIGTYDVEDGVARHKESGHALENYRAFEEAGLDPTANRGFIDTSGSGVDDRIELESGGFEGDRALFLSEASSLDADTEQDLGTSAWEERLNPDGRGNNSQGATNPDPSVPAPGYSEGKFDTWKHSPIHDGAGPDYEPTSGPDVDLNEWGRFDDGASQRGGRSRRADGRQGSSIFGGSDGSGGGDGGASGGGVSTRRVATGAAAVGGIGALAWLLL